MDLVTTQQYKTYKKIEHNKDDNQLGALIPAISQLVKTYTGNAVIDYATINKVETFDIYDSLTSELFLTESPLTDVGLIQERSSLADSYTTLTEDTDYYVDKEHDRIYRVDGASSIKYFPKGFASVKITYRAGYESCPEDLKLAVYDLITYYLKEEYKGRRSMAGATLQNEPSTSIRNDIGFPDHIKRVLDMYKIIDVI
jgi:hypothetical protein